MKRIRLLVILSFIFGCLLLFAGCGKPQLTTPTNFQVDEATLQLSWDKVKGAKGYKIDVNGELYTSTKPSYPLDPLAPGDYQITVTAIAAGDSAVDSEVSQVFPYTREKESGLYYVLINNNTEYEVRSIGKAVGDIVIEDEYRGRPITKIADMAFANKSKDVKSVTIKGNKLRTIGARAFYNCSLMTSIEIPDSVTEIGAYAFYGCRGMTSIDLPAGLTQINGYSFSACRTLESVEIPAGVHTIGTNAFSSCDALTQVVLPDTVKQIDAYAFAENVGLTSVKLGNGITTIPEYTFLNCPILQTVEFGNAVKTIEQYAFSGCELLTMIDIPDTVETIGIGAFINCTLLAVVDLPSSLQSLGAGVFNNTLIAALAVAQGEGMACIDGWIIGCDPTNMTSIVIPEGIVGICDRAFYQCDDKWEANWSVVLPNSVKYVGDYAFYKCKRLQSFSAGTGVVRIGKYAFGYCEVLRNTVLQKEGLEVIDNYAFQACDRLKMRITWEENNSPVTTDGLPSTLTRIGTYAFEGSSYWDQAMSLVYVGDWVVGCVNESLQTANLREDIRGIADYAFYGAMALSKVVIPDTVEYIGRCAFYNCSSLVEIMLPFGIQKIEDFTFYQCMSLPEIYIPASVESIGYSAFNKCYALTNVSIPAGVQYIDEYAFYKCMALQTVTFEEENGASAVESIGNRAFYNCVSLTEVSIPSSVKKLGTHVFYKCTALTSVSIGSGLTEIPKYTFYGCTALTNVTMTNSIEKIGEYAFRGCAALKEIKFSESLEEIGRYAFYGCVELESVELPASLTTIGAYAFRNCNAMTSVILPETVVSIDKHVFNGCNNATFYTEYSARPELWLGHWNTSYRTVVWGCTLSADKSYVVSFVKTATSITNEVAVNGIAAPTRDGFTFNGWTTVAGGQVAEYTMETFVSAPNGTTLYAVWAPIA